MGIRGYMLEWVMSYMKDRSLKVRLGEAVSETYDVSLGVPQGSVLGPLLFLLYVNDLPGQITSGHVTMFADDTTITVSANSLQELRVKALTVMDEFGAWCERNRFILNENKTVIINFNIQRPLPANFTLLDDFATSTNAKLLGTYFDSRLCFDTHIEHVCKQLNKAYFSSLTTEGDS